VRLDTDPRFTASEVSAAFSGAESLEVEVWQAEYGSVDLRVLKLFEGVRGVRRARVCGSVGGKYARWLEDVMMREVGGMVEGFVELEEDAYDLWTSGNR